MKKLIMLSVIFLTVISYSQNITNLLGNGALFIIKDASINYLTLSQSTGLVNILKTLRFENTTGPTVGVIYKGTDRFSHNYQAPGTDGFNTFLGINAGNFTMTGGPFSFVSSGNTGIGYNSLNSLSNGYRNTAVGFQSLKLNTSGTENTAFGTSSLFSNINGSVNTAVGGNSLYSNTTGYNNTALGNTSLNSNTTGYNNTALGYYSGTTIISGSNLTCLGNGSQPTSGSATNQITLGNNSVLTLRCNITSITALSDARDKKYIKDLSLGINFLMKLKPRLYNWDKREWYDDNVSDGTKMQETPTAGFIAQELDEVQTTENAEWLNLVLKDNPEKWEATPGNLLPIVVKAVQELKIENDGLKTENNELKERLLKLEQMQNVLSFEIEKMKSKDSNKEVILGEAK